MTNRGLILAGLASLLLGSASALAADLGDYRGGSIKDGYIPQMVDSVGARWYLRGDYSHAWQRSGSMTEPPNYELSKPSMRDANAFGAGIGYYFTSNVRADLTFDWRRDAGVRGTVSDTSATVQGERQFNISNMVALANLYYDFDTRSRFTPYIGVGLGVARNRTSAGTVATTCTTCVAEIEGASKTSAAGALMAGFSARLHDRLHLDAGYRFLYLGDAQTGDIRVTSTPTSVSPALTVRDLTAHELRVGLRWDIK